MTRPDPIMDSLEARADEVHVWRTGLDVHTRGVEGLRSLLDEDERRRMDRFKFDVHRRRYCVGRATLRRLLGAYLGIGPRTVALTYGPHGKPALDRADPSLSDVRFNVSHSADEALFAFSLERELGVDIERVKLPIDFEAIARRFFSSAELRRLLALAPDLRPGAFFECWTRKESFIKACGGGLRLPLDGFDVSFGEGVPARLLRVQWEASAVERWSMAALEVAEGFRGAITVEGGGWVLRRFETAEPA